MQKSRYGFIMQLICCLGALVYFQLKVNPKYDQNEIVVISNLDSVEKELSKYRDIIGEDYNGYRNHIYRVLSYSMHFLGSEGQSYQDLVATALVYHDIGLWSADTLAYLEPSTALAQGQLIKFAPSDLQLIDHIIMNHHKLWPVTADDIVLQESDATVTPTATDFNGDSAANTGSAAANMDGSKQQQPHLHPSLHLVVEAVRRADWIDATNGMLNKGMPWRHIATVKNAIPAEGFYKTLATFAPRLHGSNVVRWLDLLKILRW
mmetsp:Transcript_2315/g.3649  ORF Transcript_2315/g.3649 Transcript_2315/m.3649 type:complete len:263 (-) Transcript_2315:230-1018(-)